MREKQQLKTKEQKRNDFFFKKKFSPLKNSLQKNLSYYGAQTQYKYTFRFNDIDLIGVREFQEKHKQANNDVPSMSKIIGMGLNMIRKNYEKGIKITNNIKTHEPKDKITTIALTKENYEFLQKIKPEEKYKTIKQAIFLSNQIYNEKKDKYKLN